MFRKIIAPLMSWRNNKSDTESDSLTNLKKRRRRRISVLFVAVMHLLGLITSMHAVMSSRTSQGAIAWAVSANTFPYVAVPSYWVFGQSKFDGYELLARIEHHESDTSENQAKKILAENNMLLVPRTGAEAAHVRLLENISRLPVTAHNSANLLVDGEATFAAILAGIAEAEDYILFQFYIVRDDELGRMLKDALVAKAKQGVRVYFLYDELGSSGLPKTSYLTDLRDAGAEAVPFNTTQGRGNRFRLNFRNHRKIVVVDGNTAFVGGANVGDEYVNKHPMLTPWRDTHVELRGPVVQCVQAPFLEDWNWATGNKPNLNWQPRQTLDGDVAAACLPTGPADRLETGTLWFLHAINSANERLWIVSPYFVPDEQLMSVLQLAALRGVDVRILIPNNPDHNVVYWAGKSYVEEAEKAGIKLFRYSPGFLHQKVMLIDDSAAAIGTANLDNRSMRLNFEITMLMLSEDFAAEVEKMLEADFANSEPVSATEYSEASLPYRFLIRACRLMSPVL